MLSCVFVVMHPYMGTLARVCVKMKPEVDNAGGLLSLSSFYLLRQGLRPSDASLGKPVWGAGHPRSHLHGNTLSSEPSSHWKTI